MVADVSPMGGMRLLYGVALMLFLAPNRGAAELSFAGGRYVAETDVLSEANIAKDAADIREETDLGRKKEIYNNGKNSLYKDENGNFNTRSLASLSLEASKGMAQEPLYNVFRYTFENIGVVDEDEVVGQFDDLPVEQYADTIVQDLFDLNKEEIETEAALVMNVWMEVVHQLRDSLDACKNGLEEFEIMHPLDKAAAYWIGVGQLEGDNESGNLLYNLGEKAGERFNQQESGETTVNRKIIDNLNKIKTEIIKPGKCRSTFGFTDMRMIVDKIIGLMSVPLVQDLIYHMVQYSSGGDEFIELYTLSILPRIYACDPDIYDYMLNTMVLNDFNDNPIAEAVSKLQGVYHCLAITCEDVGAYAFDVVPACNNPEGTRAALAGYVPDIDVREESYIDLDIRSINMFIEMGAFDAAIEYYMHGYYSAEDGSKYRSLRDLSNHQGVSFDHLDVFASYYDSDNYADLIMMGILERKGTRLGNASKKQLAAMAVGLSQGMITWMAAIRELQYAVDECKSTIEPTISKVRSWDVGAAYMIGSLEGKERGGSPDDDGLLTFALAKRMCTFFGTCALDEAKVTSDLYEALVRGKELLKDNNCEELEELMLSDIIPMIEVPLIQATLHHAVINDGLPTGTPDASLGWGVAYTASIVPLVDESNPNTAESIDLNMEFQLTTKPVVDGAETVFDAFKAALPGMAADCIDVGVYLSEKDTYGNTCEIPVQDWTDGVDGGGGSGSDNELGFGRYTFSIDVSGFAAIARDVKEIRDAPSLDEASNIYSQGKYASVPVFNGQSQDLLSLQLFSTEAGIIMKQDPTYSLYRYAFKDEPVFIEGPSGETLDDSAYADTVVNKALDKGLSQTLAAEAAVVMNLWMQVTHELHTAVTDCESGKETTSIDKAVAFWLGEGQSEGQSDGQLLYTVAQIAGTRFGEEGEVKVNQEVMKRFSRAKFYTDQCSSDPDTFMKLRMIVARTIAWMTVPLVQNLLYEILEDTSENHIELYALSVIPQIAGCDTEAFLFLKDKLIDNDYDPDKNPGDRAEIIRTLTGAYSCLGVTCDDIGYDELDLGVDTKDICSRDTNDISYVAGYQPATNVDEFLYIDRDILNIKIFLEVGADNAAKDYYLYGRHSLKDFQSYRSLRELATTDSRSEVESQFSAFTTYFDDNKAYAHDIIILALNRGRQFQKASDPQRSAIILTALQSQVLYMYALEKFYVAVKSCTAKVGNHVSYWDDGAALLIGSLEGTESGGSSPNQGLLLFSLAKDTCGDFGTCNGSGEAESNDDLIKHLLQGKSLLTNEECDDAKDIIKNGIIPTLQVSLIQATIDFAVLNEGLQANAPDPGVGAGYVYANSILPIVDEINQTSATTINANMDFQLTSKPVSAGGAVAVFNAFKDVIGSMGINCRDIGNHPQFGSFCGGNTGGGGDNGGGDTGGGGDNGGGDTGGGGDNGDGNTDGDSENDDIGLGGGGTSEDPTTNTNLAEGLYVTTTYVQDRADISLDVRDMDSALVENDPDLAQLLYQGGLHSGIFDDEGKKIGERTLAGLSLKSAKDMKGEPIFNLFLYALKDSEGKFLGQPVEFYADTLVILSFLDAFGDAATVPAEAAVALNLWMYIVHELFQTLRNCKNSRIADIDGVHSIDEAVAYWIGDGQATGSSSGHLMYSMTEEMAPLFDQDGKGQSKVNTKILRLFNQAKLELAFPDACTENPDTYVRVRQVVYKIVSQMMIPLIQRLIHSLKKNDRVRVKMYAHSIVPLTVGCSSSTFTYLKEKLMVGTYNAVEVSTIIERLESTYSCLGLSCDDIGTYQADSASTCSQETELSLAGYAPKTDVRKHAEIDLDIRWINILMEMLAFDAAKDIYMLGQHTVVESLYGNDVISLKELATRSGRSRVPEFESFSKYFDDEKYAHSIVVKALDLNQFPNASPEQRNEIVVGTLQFMVTYMVGLQEMYDAVDDCKSNDAARRREAINSWERGIAFLTGSLEGAEVGGSNDGILLHALALDLCNQFEQCGGTGGAKVNEQLITLMYSGRGALNTENCMSVAQTADKIAALVKVPLIQASMLYAVQNEKLPYFTTHADIAGGYVVSRSLLPSLSLAKRDSATTVARNLDFQFTTKSVPDGYLAVFRAFEEALPNMAGVDCKLVGSLQGMNVCPGGVKSGARSHRDTTAIYIMSTALSLIAFAFVW